MSNKVPNKVHMVVLQVTANRPGAGKTSLIGALLSQQAAEGKTAAYYKPFSPAPDNDPDVSFISQMLLAGSAVPPSPVPHRTPHAGSGPLLTEALAQAVRTPVAALNAAADLVLIEGADLAPTDGAHWTLPLELANSLDCRVLLLFQYGNALNAAGVRSACEAFSGRLAAVVINGVTKHRQQRAAQELVAELRSGGMPVLGALPEDRAMLAVTVQQVADHLGGRWVQDPVNTGAYVDRFLIGGNIMDAGPTYFGRYANQAVITRADRPDIQMASLMEDTKCLVLTGGSEPTEYIKAEALQRDVPLILVGQSTVDIVEALGGLLDRAHARSAWKIDRFSSLVRQHLDAAALSSMLA